MLYKHINSVTPTQPQRMDVVCFFLLPNACCKIDSLWFSPFAFLKEHLHGAKVKSYVHILAHSEPVFVIHAREQLSRWIKDWTRWGKNTHTKRRTLTQLVSCFVSGRVFMLKRNLAEPGSKIPRTKGQIVSNGGTICWSGSISRASELFQSSKAIRCE